MLILILIRNDYWNWHSYWFEVAIGFICWDDVASALKVFRCLVLELLLLISFDILLHCTSPFSRLPSFRHFTSTFTNTKITIVPLLPSSFWYMKQYHFHVEDFVDISDNNEVYFWSSPPSTTRTLLVGRCKNVDWIPLLSQILIFDTIIVLSVGIGTRYIKARFHCISLRWHCIFNIRYRMPREYHLLFRCLYALISSVMLTRALFKSRPRSLKSYMHSAK